MAVTIKLGHKTIEAQDHGDIELILEGAGDVSLDIDGHRIEVVRDLASGTLSLVIDGLERWAGRNEGTG